ncbi:MAG: FGGY-family carbohydrate kinase [Marmoricola sp.]
MATSALLSVDVGTSSTKGLLVGLDGQVLAQMSLEHEVQRPRPGWVEMDASLWWDEFCVLSRRLGRDDDVRIEAVGLSGMGPCVVLTDEAGEPVRPAILYGVDTRSRRQIEDLTERYGDAEIRERCGSSLSSQAAGPKVQWVAEQEPGAYARARRLFMPASWLAYRLTGHYVLDHHSASQCTPLYDIAEGAWFEPWVKDICPTLELPPLGWPGDRSGVVTGPAASATGIPAGTAVITGTIDAWAEAVSVDAQNVGDLMLMYGTTMFLVNTVSRPVTHPALWGTVGTQPGTRCLAGGMATSGAITQWMRGLFGTSDFTMLATEAAQSPPGARGLLMLPYFSGERTPVMDPLARGVLVGLTLSHTRGDLYRAVWEATGLAVRHNMEAIRAAGGDVRRVVAVGGGVQGTAWPQIVSDITGHDQLIPQQTVGASYGGAYLAARLVCDADITAWNPTRATVRPSPQAVAYYEELYGWYRKLYPDTRELAHWLARQQEGGPASDPAPPQEE